jgi:hypothetical protein
MAQVRRVLVHVTVETAAARRKCYRKPKDHHIAKGNKCLVIRDSNMGGKKNYCESCGMEILVAAEADLRSLRASRQEVLA